MSQVVHPHLGPLAVVRVAPARTYELRQAVLRPHQEVDQMAVAGEEGPTAATVGAVTAEGEVVSTGCVVEEPPPDHLAGVVPARRAFRLRAMATRPDARRSGVGAAVLEALVDHVADQEGTLLWCNARLGAVAFYERAGFVRHGAVWEEPAMGPHVVMWRLVTPTARPDRGGR